MQLYVLQSGKQAGPFEEAEIISQWKKGILKGTDLVWKNRHKYLILR
jgi:hypothetical protein